MKKEIKDTIIVELGEKLKEYPHFYLVDVTGLNAEATSQLRRKCFKNEVKMVVVKNTLLRKALDASDVDFEPLYDCLVGSTAVMFAQTANVPAKLLKEYDKQDFPALKAAYAEESVYIGADKVQDVEDPRQDVSRANFTMKVEDLVATVEPMLREKFPHYIRHDS